PAQKSWCRRPPRRRCPGCPASQGVVPVAAIYSTFLQRAYDQIIHDVCLLRVKVIFAIDRAGLVPADGETHQGVYDPAFLSEAGMPIYSPSNYAELRYWLLRLVGPDYTGPQAIRYPRGGEVKALSQYGCTGRAYDFLTGGPEADTVLVSYGSEIGRASWRERGEESGADTAGQQNSSKVPT